MCEPIIAHLILATSTFISHIIIHSKVLHFANKVFVEKVQSADCKRAWDYLETLPSFSQGFNFPPLFITL